jgi:hypothetical protein
VPTSGEGAAHDDRPHLGHASGPTATTITSVVNSHGPQVRQRGVPSRHYGSSLQRVLRPAPGSTPATVNASINASWSTRTWLIG